MSRLWTGKSRLNFGSDPQTELILNTHARMHARNCFTALLDFVRDYPVCRHQKGKTNLDLLEQEAVSGSGINWAICKSAPWPRHITTPASHHSVFLQTDALPASQPTASKHWRHIVDIINLPPLWLMGFVYSWTLQLYYVNIYKPLQLHCHFPSAHQ